MTTLAPLPIPLQLDSHSRMDSDDQAELDQGIGTSSGPGFRSGLGPLHGMRNGGPTASIMDLLENSPIIFVGGKSLATSEDIPYQPINLRPVPKPASETTNSPTTEASRSSLKSRPFSDASPTSPTDALSSTTKLSPFPPIDTGVGWLRPHQVGSGLENVGNTCFLNSALQVLLHTPPLIRYLEQGRHDGDQCAMKAKTKYCVICALDMCRKKSFENRSSYTPGIFTSYFHKYARGLRVGRQEDAHEYLRLVIDGMQNSALCGYPPKLDQKLKESTFVHQIFGGRLRSRVACLACHHNSDTFDSILDLSLDVQSCDSILTAFERFKKVDKLTGKNQYKCEKCKKLVNAEKSFRIDEAPMVLTIHLKRFTPTGRKITDLVKYPELLSLQKYMSDSRQNPRYRLYGIINHSGGRNSGHYTAYVRSGQGKWFSMNDNFVSSAPKIPINEKNAYVLFYVKEQGDMLQEVAYRGGGRGGGGSASGMTNGAAKSGYANGNLNGNGNGNGSGQMNGNGKRPRESNGSGFAVAHHPNGIGNGNGNGNGNGSSNFNSNGNGNGGCTRPHDAPGPHKRPFTGPQRPLDHPPQVLTASASSSTPFNSNAVSPSSFFGSNGNVNGKNRSTVKIPAFGEFAVINGMKGKRNGGNGGHGGGRPNQPRMVR